MNVQKTAKNNLVNVCLVLEINFGKIFGKNLEKLFGKIFSQISELNTMFYDI